MSGRMGGSDCRCHRISGKLRPHRAAQGDLNALGEGPDTEQTQDVKEASVGMGLGWFAAGLPAEDGEGG